MVIIPMTVKMLEENCQSQANKEIEGVPIQYVSFVGRLVTIDDQQKMRVVLKLSDSTGTVEMMVF